MTINRDKCHFVRIENPRVGSSILPLATKEYQRVSFRDELALFSFSGIFLANSCKALRAKASSWYYFTASFLALQKDAPYVNRDVECHYVCSF
ncbi:hypothetical protein [Methylobacillus sp.]|uniref:hypothetical protein n=1 Tax=Methylobacillus sp. TaxID=56818 RepID=UPI002FE28F86